MSELHASYGISRSVAITLSNSATIKPTRAILLDVAGAVKVTYADGAIDTVTLIAGVWHPMRVTVLWATGTTATGLHAGY